MENEKIYKNAFDKVQMHEGRKDEIRNMIKEESLNSNVTARTFGKARIWLAAAAILIVAVFAIPTTREMTFAAARYIKSVFTMKNGITIEYSTEEESGESLKSVNISKTAGNNINYLSSKDGKLFFIIDGKEEDITDKCSETEFYKYTYDIGDGGKSVIYAGGTIEENGWIEVSYNKEGKIISKVWTSKAQETAWGEKALNDAGASKEIYVGPEDSSNAGAAEDSGEGADEEQSVYIYLDE